MDVGTLTLKGQVVIPVRLRKSLGLKKGTRLSFSERDGEIVLRPLTEDYFEKMSGILSKKSGASRQLLKSRRDDRSRE